MGAKPGASRRSACPPRPPCLEPRLPGTHTAGPWDTGAQRGGQLGQAMQRMPAARGHDHRPVHLRDPLRYPGPRDHRQRGRPREVARATHLARSQDRRRPGDLPAPRSRRGRRMSRLRRHGPAGRTGTCPRSTGAARKASPTFPVAQCHAADGRNVEACLRRVRCDWSAGGPVSRRPAWGWGIKQVLSPDHMGLIILDGTVIPPRLFRS
jgi:hypothetical protein